MAISQSMRTFIRLGILFQKQKLFPRPGQKFYVTKSGNNYQTKSGNDYTTKG